MGTFWDWFAVARMLHIANSMPVCQKETREAITASLEFQ
jgi:hypothetical protein